jgi:hypothetical protein
MTIARPLFRRLLLTLVAVLVPVGLAGAAGSPPTPASGTFTTTSAVFNSTRAAGGNTIIDLTSMVSYDGTFNGTSIVQGTLIFHPDGSANFHDVETFTGTVNGASGTVTFNLDGTGRPGTTAGSFIYRATDVVIRGTSALANIHGMLSQVGTVPAAAIGPLGTYTGQIHY